MTNEAGLEEFAAVSPLGVNTKPVLHITASGACYIRKPETIETAAYGLLVDEATARGLNADVLAALGRVATVARIHMCQFGTNDEYNAIGDDIELVRNELLKVGAV